MASRLVETVMINLDDFSDSFLTCGTCFSGYDNQERAAKLLPCSHTICRSCLERILETQAQSSSIRCPICRETVAVPAGGAGAFPPAFIVNQLLDLISTQRRDIVPKCRLHSNQELLFCETCDVVFCAECRGRSHSTPGDSDLQHEGTGISSIITATSGSPFNHNVMSFNVAIRRCTEIMLNKMHLCVQELDGARNAVTAELDRLQTNKNSCIEAVNSKFAEIVALVERRQAELLDTVKHLEEEKHRALTDQLALIESEREAICRECNRLKGILDVRSISKAITFLNDKLDKINSLTEPRENAFLCYQDYSRGPTCRSGPSQVKSSRPPSEDRMDVTCTSQYMVADSIEPASASIVQYAYPALTSISTPAESNLLAIARCLASIGAISVSTTYPALCSIGLPPQLVTYLTTKSIIHTVDYNGRPQSTGGTDPIDLQFTDAEGHSVPTELVDLNDGTYELFLRPTSAGLHQLSVRILSRPIRGSPFQINVRRAQPRVWNFNKTSDGRSLIQPFAVAYGPYPPNDPLSEPDQQLYIYLLDTGNSRLLVLDPDSGALHATLVGLPLSSQAATGIAWSPEGLWIVNWRTKSVMLLDPRTDQVTKSICSSQFVEPTSACRCPLSGLLYVADNGAGCVFRCDPITGETQCFIGSSGVRSGQRNETNPVQATDSAASASQMGNKSSPKSLLCAPETRSFRRITGLCATNNGEIVISFGSTIRIFSSNGTLLNTLIPPVMTKGTSRIVGFPRGNNLPTSSGEFHQPTDLDSSVAASRSTSSENAYSLRGHFSGVYVARPPDLSNPAMPDRFGVCLLASYSDGKRHGVFVWPNNSWLGSSALVRSSSNTNRCRSMCSLSPTTLNSSITDRFSSGATLQHSSPTACNQLCAPYLIEADPSLRRLAGLVALSDCRHLAVVDQGAQSLCRLRYA